MPQALELTHYNAERARLRVDPSRLPPAPRPDQQWLLPKPPSCLWLSQGRAWKDGAARMWDGVQARHRWQHRHEVHVDPRKLMRIRNIGDLRKFEAAYGRDTNPVDPISIRILVDWARVIRDNPAKAGIWMQQAAIDHPETWQKHYWAHLWDVESAAIWRADAVVRVVN